MNRITSCFENLKSVNRKALIPFVTAGDPEPAATLPIMNALVEGGADIIELGIPFSDPMADGPTIQQASQRALAHNTGLADVIDLVSDFRKENDTTPVVLMGYLNPVEAMGYEAFTERAAQAGVDGVLLVDLPPEEAKSLDDMLEEKDIKLIYLVAPTTGDERVASLCEAASGYLYYVSVKGVTGSNKIDVSSVASGIDRIKSHTDLPVGVGFGIRDPETAAAIAEVSDAVIVGSVLVDIVAKNQADLAGACRELTALLSAMRNSIDSVTAG